MASIEVLCTLNFANGSLDSGNGNPSQLSSSQPQLSNKYKDLTLTQYALVSKRQAQERRADSDIKGSKELLRSGVEFLFEAIRDCLPKMKV